MGSELPDLPGMAGTWLQQVALIIQDNNMNHLTILL